jgi:glycosyltransferase involved in cell wall biosynthesis
MRASTADIVTTDSRVNWLTSRRWLPKRQVLVAPVFSNLPPPVAGTRPERQTQVLGLFGYSYEGAAVSLVLDAVRHLVERGVKVQLRLLGAPGRSSPAGETWLRVARSHSLDHALSFSGILSGHDLSNALASCDVLLFADIAGPSSRKTTLAASLASGRPVIATDGPACWSELIQYDAAYVVQPTPDALADGIYALLTDETLRETLGTSGRKFAEQRMSVTRSAKVVTALLGDVVSGSVS